MKQMELQPKSGDGEVDRIKNALKDTINDDEFSQYLFVERLKDNSISVRANGTLVVKIVFRKKTSSFLVFRVGNSRYFKDQTILDYDDEWNKVDIKSVEDVCALKENISMVFVDVLKTYENESFGCCSRYLECSDAKECVHPSKIKREACQYKTNLEHGQIFYGKNKNI